MEKRFVVCSKCGRLYDLHYVDNLRIKKNSIIKFECKNCGMVDVVEKAFPSKKSFVKRLMGE